MIKNKIFFLITMISFYMLGLINVHAETNATFYEADYIDNIYMSKLDYKTNTIYYQKARFFRKSDTNEFVYCIEPFRFFEDGSIYNTTEEVNNLKDYQLEKIKKIAHFGYQYKDHTDLKWYAITQMMIWKEAGKNLGDFYFTDTLNGNRIDIFQDEIAEIEQLVKLYDLNPIPDTTFQLLENSSMAISTSSNINYYKTNSENIVIKNNTIEIKNLKEGYYEFELIREENFNNPILIYQSSNSQTLLKSGDLENKKSILKIDVHKSTIEIHKTDKDTKEETPQGEASLDGAIYGIYKQESDKKIEEVTINQNTAYLENLKSGNYYIQEITPGEGYTLDPEKYLFKISKEDYQHQFELENKVIEKEIKIIKKYGEINNLQGEKNIDFEIYNQKNEYIKTISTDNNGEVEFILPYGTYIVKQINSTNGYQKVQDFTIIVNDTNKEEIELVDYKIPVPNTYKEKESLLVWLLKILQSIF